MRWKKYIAIVVMRKRGVSNEEYYFNFTIFLWSRYFIFYCIVVWSNGCGDKKYPLWIYLIEKAFYDVPKTAFLLFYLYIFLISRRNKRDISKVCQKYQDLSFQLSRSLQVIWKAYNLNHWYKSAVNFQRVLKPLKINRAFCIFKDAYVK